MDTYQEVEEAWFRLAADAHDAVKERGSMLVKILKSNLYSDFIQEIYLDTDF